MPTVYCPKCPFCGKQGTIELSGVTLDRYLDWKADRIRFIQDALPNVSAAEREQLKTGIHPKCWDDAFSDMEDDYQDDDDEEYEDLGEKTTDLAPFKAIMDDIWQNSKE